MNTNDTNDTIHSIGIENISYYLPANSRDNILNAERLGAEPSQVINRIGTKTLPVMNKGDDTSDLGAAAVSLLLGTGLNREDIDCLILCTQNPDDHGVPHTSARIHEKLKLPTSTAVFDISLGCSGYVYGLNITRGFMTASGFTKGILVTADPYSKIVDQQDKNTALLFGDAATASLISISPKFFIKDSIYRSDGSQWQSLYCANGYLQMNGRAIFNFAAVEVPNQVKNLLESNNLDSNDIDFFIFHQGSKYIVETLAQRLSLNPDKVPICIAGIGNTISSSIPIILKQFLNNPKAKRIILSGFGVGLSWGTVLLERAD